MPHDAIDPLVVRGDAHVMRQEPKRESHPTGRSLDNIVASNLAILAGRRVFRGTRVPAEVLFENLADGLSLDEIPDSYEAPNRDDVLAVLDAAARVTGEPSGGG